MDQKGTTMPRYLIERTLPNAGQLSAAEWQAIAAKSNDVLGDLRQRGVAIQWDHSYVTENALVCVYVAPDVESIREHAHRGGFPCDTVRQVDTIIGPVTGE
jgi:hypothetical protein